MSLKAEKNGGIFSRSWFIVFAACFCCALWGSATPFIKMGYKIIYADFENAKPDIQSTILFAGIRFALAGFITIALYSIARRKVLYPKFENLGKIGSVALVQTVIQYFFFYVGLANTSGAKGTILSGSASFFSILTSSLIFRQEKLTYKKILACVIGFSGIMAVNLNGLDFNMSFMGDGFVLLSAVSVGFSYVLMKRFSSCEDPVVISGYQFMMGGAVMIVTGFALGGTIDLSDFRGVSILIYLAFLSAIAYALWGLLLKYNPVSRVTIFSFMTPVFGVVLTKLMLPSESDVSVISLIVALLLVASGVFMLNYKKTPKAEDTTEKALD